MSNSSSNSTMAGKVGMLLVILGVIGFFLGIFGAPRILAFVGLGMMTFSMIAFFIEEQQNRRASN